MMIQVHYSITDDCMKEQKQLEFLVSDPFPFHIVACTDICLDSLCVNTKGTDFAKCDMMIFFKENVL